jgi:hypothetical protein
MVFKKQEKNGLNLDEIEMEFLQIKIPK